MKSIFSKIAELQPERMLYLTILKTFLKNSFSGSTLLLKLSCDILCRGWQFSEIRLVLYFYEINLVVGRSVFSLKPSVKRGTRTRCIDYLKKTLCIVMYNVNSLRRKNEDCSVWVPDKFILFLHHSGINGSIVYGSY